MNKDVLEVTRKKEDIRSVVTQLVGSVKVIFLSYHYRANKSNIFGIRGLWRFISPPNSYMHRKCEVPGSKCRFTSRN